VVAAEGSRLGARESALVVAGQALSALGALAVGLGLANALPPDRYGALSIGLTVATLAQQAIFGGTLGGALRLRQAAIEAGEDRAFHRGLMRLLGAEAVVYGIVAGAGAAVLATRPGWSTLVLWAALFSLAATAAQALASLQAARRRRALVAAHAAAGQWLRLPAALLLIAAWGATPSAAMAGFALAAAVVLASQALLHRDWPARDAAPATADWRRRLIAYAWPFSIFGLFTWLQSSIDRWSLSWFSSLHETGLYAAVLQLGYLPLLTLSATVEQAAAPVLFALAGDGSDPARVAAACRAADRLALAALAATAALTVAAALLAPALFARLLPAEYGAVSGLLWLAVLAGGLFAVGQILSLNRLSRLEPRALLAPKIGVAGLACGLIAAGAAVAGARGVVVGQVAANAAFALWMWLASRRDRAAR
jgi:O-antigen/teichoic acid export membrane protein